MVVLTMALYSGVALASETRSGRVDIGFEGSGVFPSDDTADNAGYFGGNASYGVNNWFAVGIEAGHAETDIAEEGFDEGSLGATPLLGDLIFRYENESQFVPYGKVGLGVIFWSFDESDEVANAGIEVDVETSFAAKFAGGVDFFITPNMILNFEAGFVTSDPSATLKFGNFSVSDDIDGDFWTVGGGVKFLF